MTQAALSPAAIRLLSALRTHAADAPLRALTDKRLAALTRLPQRDVIDAAGELLAAGFLCCAACGSPPGRYLLPPTADLDPARQHLRGLERRAKLILVRRRHLRRAIQLAELGRSPDDRGQLALFPEACHA